MNKCKRMEVWSAGGPRAFDKWMSLLTSILVMMSSLLFMCVIGNGALIDTRGVDRMIMMAIVGVIGSVVIIVCLFVAAFAVRAIRRNSKFTMYMYNMQDFVSIGTIPNNKTVVFADKDGVVLCNDEDVYLYGDWRGICDIGCCYDYFIALYDRTMTGKYRGVVSSK